MNVAEKLNKEAMTKEVEKSDFISRHIGPNQGEQLEMLKALGFDNLDSFTDSVLPDSIKTSSDFSLSKFSESCSEVEVLNYLRDLADRNKVNRTYIGCGYYNTHVPGVILRNILENPGWYTQYTPYQPEISQGRLEALLNYQTMVCSLTGMEVANASLLDEGTAAAEAMYLAYNVAAKKGNSSNKFFVDSDVFPQTLAVIQTRAGALDIEVEVVALEDFNPENCFGVFVQYPAASGEISNLEEISKKAHDANALLIAASDLLALCLLKPPNDFAADIVLGSAQRFGVPMGFGGPHAAFLATKKDYSRMLPGRLVGASKDRLGNVAYRLSLQTREQHIRREKATSNICTAQVLLAIMASMYAVYHGPKRLRTLAEQVNSYACTFRQYLIDAGLNCNEALFDTVSVGLDDAQRKEVLQRASEKEINLGLWRENSLIIALDETTNEQDLKDLIWVFTGEEVKDLSQKKALSSIPKNLLREENYLQESVFNSYHSETEFLRYVKRLESKDLSLAVAMIPLGSCTMKLNATAEMIPVTWNEFANIHPFAPLDQAAGYMELIKDLENSLAEITGFTAVSLQPNAGSQGEYAGLLAIRAYHEAKGEDRKICLIPKSAHGTNPASAVIAGLQVVPVDCDENGNISLEDLEEKANQYKDDLSAFMITYPSTHGVFEGVIKKACEIIHGAGGQVYLDGANLNALVGLSKPAELGADVMHINLHKTFCIPHGGGGPGVGPIAVAKHLEDYIPSHPLGIENKSFGPVSAAPWGSAAILPISHAYIAMMGEVGLKEATQVAILNANYIAKKLDSYFPVLYKGCDGFVAHECILDFRGFKKEAGIEVEDIAKRLMDYGFHAPTVSWPVLGTIMIEPTESEGKAELDRFCDAMIGIYHEIEKIKNGEYDQESNPLKNSPHIATEVMSDNWEYNYSREIAAYPTIYSKRYKFWPAVARIDAGYGDRNLVCTCGEVEDY